MKSLVVRFRGRKFAGADGAAVIASPARAVAANSNIRNSFWPMMRVNSVLLWFNTLLTTDWLRANTWILVPQSSVFFSSFLTGPAVRWCHGLKSGRSINNGRGPAQTATCGPHKEHPMKSLVVRFVKNESGATAIEYGLIAAGISVAIIAVVQGLGTKLKATFQSVSDALPAAP